MLRLSPACLLTEGTATEWFRNAHALAPLQTRLEQALEGYAIEAQLNDNRGRMVLEAIIFSVLLDENLQVHGSLGVEIKGGVSARDPHCLSLVQLSLRDLADGQKLACFSLSFNESSEMWDTFDLMEAA